MNALLPIEVRVVALLRDRTDLIWDSRLVVLAIRDYPEVDHLEVARECCLYIAQHPGVRNGPRTLQTFLRKAEQARLAETTDARRSDELSRYNRPRN